MIGAFLWLTWRGFRNRARSQLRRVREPRYAIAMLAGLAYFWFIFFRPDRPRPMAGVIVGDTLTAVFSLGLALMVAGFWLLGSDRTPLNFSQAEVGLLFPAPITRRQLVELKLFQGQLPILLSTGIWMILLGGGGTYLWRSGLALWILFSTTYLHRMGASLVRASTGGHGVAGARRNRWALIVFAAALGAVMWSVLSALPALRTAAAGGDLLTALGDVLRGQVMTVVLFPFRLILAPLFAASSSEWLRAIGPAFLIMLLHIPWVLRTDAAFEEAAAEAAVKRAERIAAIRSRRGSVRAPRAAGRAGEGGRETRSWLPLASTGHPAGAIVWKNIIAIVRTLSSTTVAILFLGGMVALSVMLIVAPDRRDSVSIAAILILAFTGFLAIAGPLWVRNDLRLDMLRLELLRSYPLAGSSIVRAELVASALVLTTLQLVLVVVAYLVLLGGGPLGVSTSERTALLVVAVLALPAVNAANLLVQNAAALLFPAWVRLGLSRPGGVEAMGQAIVSTFGSMVVLGLILALPAIAGGILGLVLLARVGLWGLVPGAILASAMVIAELWMLTGWMGGVFEKQDSALGIQGS